MIPRKILTRSVLISLNTVRQSHFNVVRMHRVNAVKASTCWVWRPIKPDSALITLKRYDYVDGNPETELEDSVRLTITFITFPVEKEVKSQEVGVTSVTIVNCCFTFRRELSGKEAWEAIENFAQGKKEWDNPPNIIFEQEVENLKAQEKRLFRNENVWVEMHRGIAWDKVENSNPQSTPQVLTSFEKNTPPVTYPDEVEEIIGISIEVEPLDETPFSRHDVARHVATTWQVNDQSTTAGPPVNGGCQRWPAMVNGGGPSPNHRSTVVDSQSTGGVRSGNGPGRGLGLVGS
ncbi:hypothetical protein Tco_1459540 [Tanacetum coccineum]